MARALLAVDNTNRTRYAEKEKEHSHSHVKLRNQQLLSSPINSNENLKTNKFNSG